MDAVEKRLRCHISARLRLTLVAVDTGLGYRSLRSSVAPTPSSVDPRPTHSWCIGCTQTHRYHITCILAVLKKRSNMSPRYILSKALLHGKASRLSLLTGYSRQSGEATPHATLNPTQHDTIVTWTVLDMGIISSPGNQALVAAYHDGSPP